MPFRHCGIIGLGLLGGSLALDLRRIYPELALTGVARREATLAEARALQVDGRAVFSGLATELAAVRDADLVILCTPVQTMLKQLAELAAIVTPGTVITDVGSTKRLVMNAAQTVLPADVHFIGGHPMAGSEQKGLAYARHGLYANATWALCVPVGGEEVAERLTALVTALGARPLRIDADEHDGLVALTSHLPHVVAGALASQVLGSAADDAVRPFIAGGFRDTTRIAAADPVMWRDIFLTNRDKLIPVLNAYLAEVEQWRDAISAGDAPHVEALLTVAGERRKKLG